MLRVLILHSMLQLLVIQRALIFLFLVNQLGCKRYASCKSCLAAQILSWATNKLFFGPFSQSRYTQRLAMSFRFFIIDLGSNNATFQSCSCLANETGVHRLIILMQTSARDGMKSHSCCQLVASKSCDMGPNVAGLVGANHCSIIFIVDFWGWHVGMSFLCVDKSSI